jgi:GT2 family glycosyltransferase
MFKKVQRWAHHAIGASIQGGNYIVKREALLLAGGHSTEIEFYGEDTDLALRLSKFGSIKLLNAMWIHASARRFERQGYLNTSWTYVLNYLSIHLRGKPMTKTHVDYRGSP